MTLFKKKTPKEYIIYSAIIVFGIFIDQLTKFFVYNNMVKGQSIPLIDGFLHITYTTNPGAAFGMMEDQRWIFIVVSTLAIIAFMAYLYLGHAENMRVHGDGGSTERNVQNDVGGFATDAGQTFQIFSIVGNHAVEAIA